MISVTNSRLRECISHDGIKHHFVDDLVLSIICIRFRYCGIYSDHKWDDDVNYELNESFFNHRLIYKRKMIEKMNTSSMDENICCRTNGKNKIRHYLILLCIILPLQSRWYESYHVSILSRKKKVFLNILLEQPSGFWISLNEWSNSLI